MAGFPDDWIVNTPTPVRDFALCHCHGWRRDTCPNIGVALLFRALSRED
jgi:hypothetical protein